MASVTSCQVVGIMEVVQRFRHPTGPITHGKVADVKDQLVGYVEAQGGAFRRNRHFAYVVIGVQQAFAGRGIGTALLADLSTWALQQIVHRLELTVMASNQRAIALYRKSGYVIEGTRRHSVRIAGSYVDELAMAKFHPQEDPQHG